MEAALVLLSIFAVLAFVMIRNANDEKRKILNYRNYLKDNYGSYPVKEEKPEDFILNMALYLHEMEADESREGIDDITWHDFGMDEVYKNINFTQSAAGAEYLYWLLRSPYQDNEFRKNLSKDIEIFQKNSDERLETQMRLNALGRISRFSLFDYLDFLDTLGERNNTKHFIGLVLLIISIASIFVSTPFGIVFFLVVMSYQMGTYLKEKSFVEPFISTFSYCIRMIDAGKNVQNICGKISIKKALDNHLNLLSGFSKSYNSLFKLNASTGNPLDIIFEYIKMITHIDLIQFNNTLNQVQLHRNEFISLSKDIGYIDASISIGAFRESLEYYCEPVFNEELLFSIEDGFHPLIDNPVPNSINQSRGMLITGSNASGKSTFLRMVGINALLAQTIMTVCAKKYEAPVFSIYSSMSLQDNLSGGESYYMVEIKSLKRILDAIADLNRPVLCFVDEVLRGTNTVERIAASTQILKSIANYNVFCFATTHDIELTSLLDNLYDNFHFEEEVHDNDVLFSYHLKDGKAKTRNAIKLLQIIGFSEEIIRTAEDQALDFMNTGEWHVC